MTWEVFFPPGMPVMALPTWENPRLYLPARGLFQRWKGSALYPAFRTGARLYRLLLRTRAAVGLGAVRVNQSDGWPLREFIQNLLPQLNNVVVLVGTSTPPKIIVQLWDEYSEVMGYLKYIEGTASHSRLQQEYSVLAYLPEDVGPVPLKYGSLNGGTALCVTAVPGKLVPAKLPPAAGIDRFLQTLIVVDSFPFEMHPWVQTIQARGEKHVERWLEALAGRPWPVVIQHGDFAPWNLLYTLDGRVRAIDWEYGSGQGFPYLDLAHYVLQVAAHIYRWSPSEAMRYAIYYLTHQTCPALKPAEIEAITQLTAYRAYWQFLEDGLSRDHPLQVWRRTVWESRRGDV
jgi:hypothetical protein